MNGLNDGEMTSLIRLKIQNVFTSILIDSGAAHCAIDLDYATKLGVKIKNLEIGDAKFLQAANQTRVDIMGKCVIEMQLNSNKINFEFLVLRDLSVKCLVGIDFLQHFKVKQDYEKGTVLISGLGEIDFIRLKVLNDGENRKQMTSKTCQTFIQ